MWFFSLAELWVYVGRNVLFTFVRQMITIIMLYFKTLDPHLTMAL